MKMRAPATPLIAVDPYFNIWSMGDRLAEQDTLHWTGYPHRLVGTLTVDGNEYRFMGRGEGAALPQQEAELDLFSSYYVFQNELLTLRIHFTSPLMPQDFELLSRPVSFLSADISFHDGAAHESRLSLTAYDEIVLNNAFDSPTVYHSGERHGFRYATLENSVQRPLCRAGDDLRIEWGRLIIASANPQASFTCRTVTDAEGRSMNCAELSLPLAGSEVIALAYDDQQSLLYFDRPLSGYWKRYYGDIFEAIQAALQQYPQLIRRCRETSAQILAEAKALGGEEYAGLLVLAWRQTLASHKLASLPDGEPIFVSKECFSDGDAATVDVTYPSAPMFLLYNPALLKAMIAPIFAYAESELWEYDCAPHDLGLYPILDGQAYKNSQGEIMHMPVEECGNMVILTAAYLLESNDLSFAQKHNETLKQWVRYLLENGEDPDNQLCTDDFAGRSPHNCNLTLKAIMGIAGYGLICGMLGDTQGKKYHLECAQTMAQSWTARAVEPDGGSRRAFDQPGTFSLKYNVVWDRLFGTNLFSEDLLRGELRSYLGRMNRYGVPLDNRADYTKSDWILWCASLCESSEDFRNLIRPVWSVYNETEDRVPMGDWYDTVTGRMKPFRNRTVQGAMFLPLLMKKHGKQYR